MNITSIFIVISSGTDDVFLVTDLPPAAWPWEGHPSVKLQCAHGTGEEYCRKNFPDIPTKVVKV